MENCNLVSTPIKYRTKLSKKEKVKIVDSIMFKSLIKSLRYITCTRPNILYEIQIFSWYKKMPLKCTWKQPKNIFDILKVLWLVDFSIFILMNFNLQDNHIVIELEIKIIKKVKVIFYFIWAILHLHGIKKTINYCSLYL